MRNPNWHRDEIMLALDLYFELDKRNIGADNPRVIELSNLLNRLPIHPVKNEGLNFRNPNGVSMKLSNFLAIDDSYAGVGMKAYSKLDYSTFFEFVNNKSLLKQLVNNIKVAVFDDSLNQSLNKITDDEDDDDSVQEGNVLFRLHKLRERNKKIVRKKKEQYFKLYEKLDCEICEFDFHRHYGEHGKGFIECHHRTPLAQLNAFSTTTVKDLALVCANCHRMLHRKMSLSISELTHLYKHNLGR